MSCNKKLMCDLNLNTQAATRTWLLQHHPDKNKDQTVDSKTFTDVVTCYKNRSFCVGGNPPGPPLAEASPIGPSPKRRSASAPRSAEASAPLSANASAPRSAEASAEGVVGAQPLGAQSLKIFNCMRQTENWSKILPQYKLDNKKFDPQEVKLAIHNASPKLEQLFQIIEQVDANDMKTHGQYFKHFIYSDVKEEGYGAKILASAFIANGYKNLITAKTVPGQKSLKLTLMPTGADGKNKAFGLLSSSAIFNSEFNQKFKKEILTMYNKRPDNIQGENMRFIILDSGFKEGIDLFDVKYVHIFEPSLTVADLKQTIGRATRTCGQKGLNFEPNVGWPLFVYNYYIVVPDEIKEVYEATQPSLLKYPEEDTKIFQRATKLKDAAILYSNYDKTLTNLAEQLYKLAPVFSVDFELTKNIHRIDDMAYLYEQQQASVHASMHDTTSHGTTTHGTTSHGGALKDKATVDCKGKCGLRSTKDIPATVNFLYKVYVKYGHNRALVPAKHPRAYLCAYMKQSPAYCDQVNKEWANRAAFVPYLVEKKASDTSTRRKTARKTARKTRRSQATARKTARKTRRSQATARKTARKTARSHSPLQIANEVMQELELVPYVAPTAEIDYAIVEYTGKPDTTLKQKKAGPPPKKLSFQKMRDFIKTNYGKQFIWGEIKVENKCVEQAEQQAPKAQQEPAEQKGGASRIMSLNPTQDFVRTFFTPQSPYKGLLLFQSVGTGKTCSAIATATASFEPEGYTILWVTRTTLKSDVYKNMFDDVCHILLAEKMKQGLVMPDDLTRRKKLLSKNWIEPISYKTFSNLLTPGAHNEYMDKLIQRNGKADILRKTLIIIDEAHKLYGGDLKAGERPDMAVMERLLQKSYEVSGKDSARLLIMTATPFTNSPLELFQLINLCKETPSEKITTDLRAFKAKYMNADALLTEAGVKTLADKMSGYISYLNREQDPTQFAQPIMIEVPVIMSHILDDEVRREIFRPESKKVASLNKVEAKYFVKQQEVQLKALQKRLKETQKKVKEKQTRCKSVKKRGEKARCLAEIDEEMRETIETLKNELESLKASQADRKGLKQDEKKRVKEMKERLETLRKDLLQEVMLVERCKNIKLV